MSNLSKKIMVCIGIEELEKIDNILKNKIYKYNGRSHFIRCAIMRLIEIENKIESRT